jgi:chromosome segregation ATPase
MMRSILSTAFLILFLSLPIPAPFLSPLFAQAENSPEARAALRSALTPSLIVRVQNLLENVRARLTARATRLEHIETRLRSRMKKSEAQGEEISGAREALDRAQSSIEAGRQALTALTDSSMEQVVYAEKPREAFLELRTHIVRASHALTASTNELRSAVSILHGTLPQKADIESMGTTSNETTTTPL